MMEPEQEVQVEPDKLLGTLEAVSRRAALVAQVQERYQRARAAKLPMLRPWAACLAYYIGEQWRRWDSVSRRMVESYKVPSWRVRSVSNQLPGIIETAAGKLMRGRHAVRALAATGDEEDRAAARLGTQALRSWALAHNLPQLELEAEVQRLLFGTAFFHDYWDPARRARLRTPEGSALVAVGDACVEVLTVFDVFPEPTEQWQDVAWVVVARRKPTEWIEDTFGLPGGSVSPESGDDDVFTALLPAEGEGQVVADTSSSGRSGQQLATLLLYYALPTRKYPEGQHVIVCGDRVLYEGGLDHPHGELPVTPLLFRMVPKRLWGMGLAEGLLGLQRELNTGLSHLAEIMRLHRSPKWMVPAGSVKADSITSAPDEVVEYAGPQPPIAVPPPGLPGHLVTYPALQREEIRQYAGQHEVSQGQVPAGVGAASAISLLQQADNARLSAPSVLGAAAMTRMYRHVLSYMAAFYGEQRLILTYGRDRTEEVTALSGAEIGERDVLVDLTDGVEDTEALRQQQAQDWIAQGLLTWVASPLRDGVVALLREIGLGWLADWASSVVTPDPLESEAPGMGMEEPGLGMGIEEPGMGIEEPGMGMEEGGGVPYELLQELLGAGAGGE